ncbi:hypothetical protein UACE39S_06084 [Ureibacillus acetophenoni]
MYMSTATTKVTQKSAGHRASSLAAREVGGTPVRVGRRFAIKTPLGIQWCFFVRRAVAPCATTAQDELLKVGGCYRGNNNSRIPEGSSSRR